MSGREPAHRGQCLGRLARRGREIVIEGEHDARRIGDTRACHLVLEHLHHEVGAQVVHDHQIDVADDDILGLNGGPPALARQDLLDDVHRTSTVPRPCTQVSP